MSIYDVLSDFAIASLLILIGQFLRAKIKFFQEFFIPSSLIAGLIALLLGGQFLDVLHFSSGAGSYAGMLIIIVFTVVGINGFEIKKGEGAATVKRVTGYNSAFPCVFPSVYLGHWSFFASNQVYPAQLESWFWHPDGFRFHWRAWYCRSSRQDLC